MTGRRLSSAETGIEGEDGAGRIGDGGVMALRQAIDRDRYPFSWHMRPFKTALAKLD